MTPEKITEIFCLADNFVKLLEKHGLKKSSLGRKSMLCISEYITLLVIKQHWGLKTNKDLYYIAKAWLKPMFSKFPSYQQFNDGINKAFPFLLAITTILINNNKKKKADFYIVDSLPLPICSNGHRYNLKIDMETASAGKNINGWYYGYKLHMIINENMEIVGIKVTDASVKDYDVLENNLIKGLIGWLVGDKGYICKKKQRELNQKGIFLLTKPRKNMKKYPAHSFQCYFLSQRQRIESVFSKLKHRFSIVNEYARSICGYFVNVLSSIITYCFEKMENLEKRLAGEYFGEITIS